ncbi:hypothetical protein HK104_000659, partial [Borealophlyctis nickersoniae]
MRSAAACRGGGSGTDDTRGFGGGPIRNGLTGPVAVTYNRVLDQKVAQYESLLNETHELETGGSIHPAEGVMAAGLTTKYVTTSTLATLGGNQRGCAGHGVAEMPDVVVGAGGQLSRCRVGNLGRRVIGWSLFDRHMASHHVGEGWEEHFTSPSWSSSIYAVDAQQETAQRLRNPSYQAVPSDHSAHWPSSVRVSPERTERNSPMDVEQEGAVETQQGADDWVPPDTTVGAPRIPDPTRDEPNLPAEVLAAGTQDLHPNFPVARYFPPSTIAPESLAPDSGSPEPPLSSLESATTFSAPNIPAG